MLYRLATPGIVAFWLVMSGLLVRLEVRPDKSAILDVPVSYVIRIMFKNAQQSVLSLREGETPVGTLSLRPHIPAEDRRLLDFSGNFLLQLPGLNRQRLGLSGSLEMDKALKVQNFNLEATTQAPQCRLIVQGRTSQGFLKYQLYDGPRLIGSQPLPLEMSAIAGAILQAAGIPMDPTALPLMQSNFTAPTLSARETRITLHGEEVDVFQLSVHESGTTVADIYISQLGQIIQANTNFGYSLISQDFR